MIPSFSICSVCSATILHHFAVPAQNKRRDYEFQDAWPVVGKFPIRAFAGRHGKAGGFQKQSDGARDISI
jgi:hypothetical protein